MRPSNLQSARPVAGSDFFGSLGDFVERLPGAVLQIAGTPITIGAEIAQRAGICDGCAAKWVRLLDSIGEWTVDLTTSAIYGVVTDPATWTALALAASQCLGSGGIACAPALGALSASLAVKVEQEVQKTIERRAREGAKDVIMTLEERAKNQARAEADKLISSATAEAGATARAAAGDLLYSIAPRALLDLLERGGPDADQVISQTVAPIVQLAARLAPLAGSAETAAAVQEARLATRGALMTAVRASIRTGAPVETTARASLEPLFADLKQRIRTAAFKGAAAATGDLGGNLQNLSLAWDPRQVRAALVDLYAQSAGSPGDPRRVAATARIWQVAMTARELTAAPLVVYTAAREARINAIAQAAPLAAIRSALRARDRIAPDKPYPYADQAIRRYIERKAETARPVMLNGQNNSASAIAAALAPGMAAELGVRPPAPIAATGPAAVQALEAERMNFADQLTRRSAAATQRAAAQADSKPWGKIAAGVAVAFAVGYAATR